jgi:hypothetical protein
VLRALSREGRAPGDPGLRGFRFLSGLRLRLSSSLSESLPLLELPDPVLLPEPEPVPLLVLALRLSRLRPAGIIICFELLRSRLTLRPVTSSASDGHYWLAVKRTKIKETRSEKSNIFNSLPNY